MIKPFAKKSKAAVRESKREMVTLHCKCENYSQGALDVVQCRACRRWAHERCFGFPQMNTVAPADFLCHSCREFPWRQDADGLIWRGICICGVDEDVNAACEQCERWAHVECMGVSLEEVASGIVPFVCFTCRVQNGETFPEGPRTWRTAKEVQLALEQVKRGITVSSSGSSGSGSQSKRRKGSKRKRSRSSFGGSADATATPPTTTADLTVAAGALTAMSDDATSLTSNPAAVKSESQTPPSAESAPVKGEPAAEPVPMDCEMPLPAAPFSLESSMSIDVGPSQPSSAMASSSSSDSDSVFLSAAVAAASSTAPTDSTIVSASTPTPVPQSMRPLTVDFTFTRDDVMIPHYVERRARFGAAADCLTLYASTTHFFESSTVQPAAITLGPLASLEADPSHPLEFLVGSLSNWLHDQSGYASDLAVASRGCVQLPDVGSCFASAERKLATPELEDAVYWEKVREAPFAAWPAEPPPKRGVPVRPPQWTFSNHHRLIGSPFLDDALRDVKEMLQTQVAHADGAVELVSKSQSTSSSDAVLREMQQRRSI